MCNTGGSTPHSLLPAAYVFIGLTLGFIFLGCKSGKSYFLRSSGIPVLLAKVSSNPRRHSTTTNPFSIRYYSKAKITLVWRISNWNLWLLLSSDRLLQLLLSQILPLSTLFFCFLPWKLIEFDSFFSVQSWQSEPNSACFICRWFVPNVNQMSHSCKSK